MNLKTAATLFLFVVTLGCRTTPKESNLAGLRCDGGRCASGYACDGSTNTCIVASSCEQVGADGSCLRCGDGVVSAVIGEACDRGSADNTGAYGGCTVDCQLAPHCGDGVVQGDYETCDDGAAASNAWQLTRHCQVDCRAFAPHCGDGIMQAEFEGCDGGTVTIAGCGADCQTLAGWSCAKRTDQTGGNAAAPDNICYQCGDGVLDPTEECDGGASGMPGCGNDCKALEHWSCKGSNICYECGNGVKDPGEVCDDGDTDWCTPPCGGDCQSTVNTCGDGVARCGEECDGGATMSFSCQALGFAEAGTPTCDPASCRVDRTGCACGAFDADFDGDGSCDAADATPAGVSACSGSSPGAVLLAKLPLAAADAALPELLARFGYRVSVLACPAASAVQDEASRILRAAAKSRLVVIGPSCSDADVSASVLGWLRQGVVVLSPALFAPAGLASGTKESSEAAAAVHSNNFVTMNLGTSAVGLVAGPTSVLSGVPAAAVVLARAGELPAAVAAETGASLLGGGAAGRRLALGLGKGDLRQLGVSGRAFFERALLWAAGADDASTCQFCAGIDADGDGYGSDCDCDDTVPTCNDGSDAGTSELPARDCVTNFDSAGELSGASPAYVAPDCYEVFCGASWAVGGAVSVARADDCLWATGAANRTLADVVSTANGATGDDKILLTGSDVTYASDLVLEADKGAVSLTAVVTLDMGGHNLTINAANSELQFASLIGVQDLLLGTGATLRDSQVTNSGSITLGASATLRDSQVTNSGSIAVEVTGNTAVLDGVHIDGCTDTGVLLRADGASLQHSRIGCGNYGIVVDGTGLGNNAATDNVIANNVVVGSGAAAIHVAVNSDNTTIDNNTLTGVPNGDGSSWSGPAVGIDSAGPQLNLCMRNNIFSYLGDGSNSGYAVSLAGAITFVGSGDTGCRGKLPDVTWNNTVAHALDNCSGAGCASLPCKDYAGQSVCQSQVANASIIAQRFFEFSLVDQGALGFVDTTPARLYTDAANWCIDAAVLIDAAADLGYARVPPFSSEPSFVGAGPDIGGVEVGAGECQ